MKVEVDIALGLVPGGVSVVVNDAEVEVVALSDLVRQMIEAHEIGDSIQSRESLDALAQARLALSVAAHLIEDRLELERSKVRARS